MEEPIPRPLALAHKIVELVRKADVSSVEQTHALKTARLILGCYSDRGSYPAEWENSDSRYHRPETHPAS